MNLGKMDRRILLEQSTAPQDSFGQGIPTWSEVARPWARVEYKQGGEKNQADEEVAIQWIDFTIRYRKPLNARYRITYEGQVYDIEAVAEIGRRQGLKLSTYTRNDDGR